MKKLEFLKHYLFWIIINILVFQVVIKSIDKGGISISKVDYQNIAFIYFSFALVNLMVNKVTRFFLLPERFLILIVVNTLFNFGLFELMYFLYTGFIVKSLEIIDPFSNTLYVLNIWQTNLVISLICSIIFQLLKFLHPKD